MFMRRAAFGLARSAALRPVAARPFSSAIARLDANKDPKPGQTSKHVKPFEEIQNFSDLMPEGAQPGTIPTDVEQATGLERLEILGKMQGIDVFDMKPLDSSRKGTMKEPIVVRSYGDEQYVGCTGSPADSHVVNWLTMSRDRPLERCPECGSCYMMEYVGPQESHDAHGHGHDEHHADVDGSHNFDGEPKTLADFVRPEYR